SQPALPLGRLGPATRNRLTLRSRPEGKPPQTVPPLPGDRYPLPNAQRLPDHFGMLRRRQIVEPGHTLVVTVLGDGAEGGQLGADRRPGAGRAALDVRHPGPGVAASVDVPARPLDAPRGELVAAQGLSQAPSAASSWSCCALSASASAAVS